jgi:hypothetical protein
MGYYNGLNAIRNETKIAGTIRLVRNCKSFGENRISNRPGYQKHYCKEIKITINWKI